MAYNAIEYAGRGNGMSAFVSSRESGALTVLIPRGVEVDMSRTNAEISAIVSNVTKVSTSTVQRFLERENVRSFALRYKPLLGPKHFAERMKLACERLQPDSDYFDDDDSHITIHWDEKYFSCQSSHDVTMDSLKLVQMMKVGLRRTKEKLKALNWNPKVYHQYDNAGPRQGAAK
eukprot:gene16292-19333_t